MKLKVYKVLLFTILSISYTSISTVNAQLNLDHWESLSFRNIGPSGMSGRVTAIDVDLSDSDRILVGTASGGVWHSENGGVSWKPIFDDQPTLSIGSVKIFQKNPDIIWVGTGEGNPRNSVNVGGGIYKSIDGGKTWKSMGLEKSKAIHRIILHPDNPMIAYAGAMGSPWGPHPERGVFKTTDGGKTWNKILYVNDNTGVGDMVVDPTNPDKIIVGMYEHMRTPWDFTSGGSGSGMHITYDGGENWKKITSKEGLPKGELGRIGIAIAPSMPDRVYALVEAKENGLYRSDDGGENWSLVSKKNIGNRPFYYSEIYVDPINENRIYNLWSYVSLSEDAGKTFRTIMDYGNAVHPDHHAFWIHPEDPSYLINGNDGGMNISRDRGETWQFINNLPVGQFYHVNIDNDWPYHVYGGMQDNGSWIGPSMVLKSGGIRNYDFQELYFGDGFDVVPHPKDSRYGWAMSQGGNLGFYDRETGNVKFAKPNHPEGKELRFNWNAPIAQDPFNDCGVYYGSQYVHYTNDCGDSWIIMSPDLTTNDTSKQHQDISGGLTIDATNAENHTTLLSIAPSPVDQKVIWVGSDDGNLQLTTDGGKTWTKLNEKLKNAPKGAWIPQIIASNKNAGEAFVVINNYRKNDFSAYTYHTSDYGKTFKRIVDDAQVGGFVLSIAQDPIEPNLLFLGTDVGLYWSYNMGKNWQRLDKGFPHVQVSDLKIHPREHDLVIGTFGRAFWILDDIRPLRKIAQEGMDLLKKEMVLFDPPTAYHVSRRSYDGIRFNAQGEFVGDNKSIGYASIGLWTPPAENDEEEKEKEVKLFVKNATGDTIRTISRKIESGYDRVGWYLDEDGVRYPSRRTAKKEDDLPGGAEALPGTYKVIIKMDDVVDSVSVEVKADPRIEGAAEAMKAQYAAAKDMEITIEKAAKSFENIKDMKASIKKVKSLLEGQPKEVKTAIDSLHKALSTSLDSLENLFMMPEDLKGIQRNPNTLNSKLSQARSYAGRGFHAPGPNAQIAIEIAEKQTMETVQAVNQFIETDWMSYQEYIKTITFDPLKKVDKVE